MTDYIVAALIVCWFVAGFGVMFWVGRSQQ